MFLFKASAGTSEAEQGRLLAETILREQAPASAQSPPAVVASPIPAPPAAAIAASRIPAPPPASGEGARAFPLNLAMQRQLTDSRRTLFDDLARHVNAKKQRELCGEHPLTPQSFTALQRVQDARRQLATADYVHQRVGALLHTTVLKPTPQDPLLTTADACWRPLALGRAMAAWLACTSLALGAWRRARLLQGATARLAERRLLTSWDTWARYAIGRQRRELAHRRVERRRARAKAAFRLPHLSCSLLSLSSLSRSPAISMRSRCDLDPSTTPWERPARRPVSLRAPASPRLL